MNDNFRARPGEKSSTPSALVVSTRFGATGAKHPSRSSSSSGDQRDRREEGGSGWKKGRAFHLSFISVTQSSVQCPIQWLAPALCKIMLIPLLPVLSHLYKLPSRPLKSNYISLRCCQEKKKKKNGISISPALVTVPPISNPPLAGGRLRKLNVCPLKPHHPPPHRLQTYKKNSCTSVGFGFAYKDVS